VLVVIGDRTISISGTGAGLAMNGLHISGASSDVPLSCVPMFV
jgi:hypothetical protein